MIRLLIMLLGGVMIGRFLASRRRQPVEHPPPESLVTDPTVEAEARRREDGKIEITWQDDLGAVRVYAGTRPDNIDRDTPLGETQGDTQRVVIDNPDPTLRHFFEITGDDNTLAIAERILPLEGVANFRDIGGYVTTEGRRVRWGRVYRSGSISNPTRADLEHLNSIGIKLICDLRTPEEVEEAPDVMPESAVYKHTPVENDEENAAYRRRRAIAVLFNRSKLNNVMREVYIDVMIEKNAKLIGDILRDIAEEDNLPMVYHCAAGKDRTGIMSALLLTLLGVPEATIIADYTLSNRYYEAFRVYAERNIRHFRVFGVSTDDLYPLLIADANLMQETLDHIRNKYGSIHAYLVNKAGIDDTVIARLKANLLA